MQTYSYAVYLWCTSQPLPDVSVNMDVCASEPPSFESLVQEVLFAYGLSCALLAQVLVVHGSSCSVAACFSNVAQMMDS